MRNSSLSTEFVFPLYTAFTIPDFAWRTGGSEPKKAPPSQILKTAAYFNSLNHPHLADVEFPAAEQVLVETAALRAVAFGRDDRKLLSAFFAAADGRDDLHFQLGIPEERPLAGGGKQDSK